MGEILVDLRITHFSTAFLILQSLYKHKDGLKTLFVSEHWYISKLVNTEAEKRVCHTLYFLLDFGM